MIVTESTFSNTSDRVRNIDTGELIVSESATTNLSDSVRERNAGELIARKSPIPNRSHRTRDGDACQFISNEFIHADMLEGIREAYLFQSPVHKYGVDTVSPISILDCQDFFSSQGVRNMDIFSGSLVLSNDHPIS